MFMVRWSSRSSPAVRPITLDCSRETSFSRSIATKSNPRAMCSKHWPAFPKARMLSSWFGPPAATRSVCCTPPKAHKTNGRSVALGEVILRVPHFRPKLPEVGFFIPMSFRHPSVARKEESALDPARTGADFQPTFPELTLVIRRNLLSIPHGRVPHFRPTLRDPCHSDARAKRGKEQSTFRVVTYYLCLICSIPSRFVTSSSLIASS